MHKHHVTVTCNDEAACSKHFGSGAHTIACTCGEKVTYNGHQFTTVEAERHAKWHAEVGR